MSDLTARPPATSVIEECLRLRSLTPPRGAVARLFGTRPLSAETVSWFTGAIGEVKVGELLAQLDPAWTVLHAVPTGNAETDIDHVVIGPGGAFSINTKHHPGKRVWVSPKALLVSGQKQHHLRNSRSEAKRATTALGISVIPIIALVGVEKLTIKESPGDVEVLRAEALVRWLKKRPEVITSRQVGELVSRASDVRTWHSTHTGAFDSSLTSAFEELRREDSIARVRRVLWSLLALAGVGVGLLFALQALLTVLNTWPEGA